ncbi:MAG: multiple sugar-binding protein, partial [Oscillospiraceae bacterium]
MITKRIRFCAAFMAATLLLGLTSCSGKPVVLDDILSQKPISASKIPITVLVKSAFSIASFEKEIEKKFPQVDIIQVGNYSANMGIAEYEARMKNDDLTDLVMTWPLEVG